MAQHGEMSVWGPSAGEAMLIFSPMDGVILKVSFLRWGTDSLGGNECEGKGVGKMHKYFTRVFLVR
jgi:hypothetical protein